MSRIYKPAALPSPGTNGVAPHEGGAVLLGTGGKKRSLPANIRVPMLATRPKYVLYNPQKTWPTC